MPRGGSKRKRSASPPGSDKPNKPKNSGAGTPSKAGRQKSKVASKSSKKGTKSVKGIGKTSNKGSKTRSTEKVGAKNARDQHVGVEHGTDYEGPSQNWGANLEPERGMVDGIQTRSRSRSRNKSKDSEVSIGRSITPEAASSRGSSVHEKSPGHDQGSPAPTPAQTPEQGVSDQNSRETTPASGGSGSRGGSAEDSANRSNSAQVASGSSDSSESSSSSSSEESEDSTSSSSGSPVRKRSRHKKKKNHKKKGKKHSHRRRLNYDRRSGEFTPSDRSPAAVGPGAKERQLDELQKYLDDPKKVESALELLRHLHGESGKRKRKHSSSGRSRSTTRRGSSDRQGSRRRDERSRERHSGRRSRTRSTGEPNVADSETTLYTRGIKSVQGQSVDTGESPQEQNSIEQLTAEIDSLGVAGSPSAEMEQVTPDSGVDPMMTQRDRRRNTVNETDEQIQDAERRKATLEKPPGRQVVTLNQDQAGVYNRPGSTDLKCDDKYFELGVHVRDEATRGKIERGEFVELPKLYPKDRVPDDEGRLQLVNKDGTPQFVPSETRDMVPITSFERWQVAFEVYAGIYTRKNPVRAPEIFQYIHKIRKAAEVYQWVNVYTYDKLFRTHMSENPGRSWASSLRDAWDNNVRETLQKSKVTVASAGTPPSGDKKRKKGYCWKFNKSGYCSSGSNCEWDHRCSVCGLPNHGKYNCRKRERRDDREARAKPKSSRK